MLRKLIKSRLESLERISEGNAWRAAVLIWAVYACVLALIMVFQPDIGKVMTIYRDASAAWWSGEAIYVVSARQGFFYLPHAAILLTPVLFFPVVVGEVLWRLVLVALLASSVWQLAGAFGGGRRKWTFLVMTAVAVALSLSAARYGQTNVPLAAFIALAAVGLGRAAWKSSALWLLLSVASKPVGLVACLLAGACYPRKMILPLACGAVLFGAVAFAHPDPRYVAGQYKLFGETMGFAQLTPKHSFCDVQGLLRTFGWLPPHALMTAVRALAAAAVLLLAWLSVRRYDPVRGAFLCMLLAALYLLLFNPRTESNSYVLLAPFIGVLLADAARRPGELGRFLWLMVFAAALTCENWGPLHRWTDLWFKAAATLVFSGFLIRDILAARDPFGLRDPAGQPAGLTS
jgi:alpha-1,2-mannosyltransferase